MPTIRIDSEHGPEFVRYSEEYKAGEMPPETGSWLDKADWAEVQLEAGLTQEECTECGLWRFPQELTDAVPSRCVYCVEGKPCS